MNFVSVPAQDDGSISRAHLIDDTININTGQKRGQNLTNDVAHPDFLARIKTRHGKPKFTDRLGAYLAVIISAHYHEEV